MNNIIILLVLFITLAICQKNSSITWYSGGGCAGSNFIFLQKIIQGTCQASLIDKSYESYECVTSDFNIKTCSDDKCKNCTTKTYSKESCNQLFGYTKRLSCNDAALPALGKTGFKYYAYYNPQCTGGVASVNYVVSSDCIRGATTSQFSTCNNGVAQVKVRKFIKIKFFSITMIIIVLV